MASWRIVSWCLWTTSRNWQLRRLRALCLRSVWASGWSSWSATSSPSHTAWWRRSTKPAGRVHPAHCCPTSITRGATLFHKEKWDDVVYDGMSVMHCAPCVSAVVVLWVKEWRAWLRSGPGLLFLLLLRSSVEPGDPVRTCKLDQLLCFINRGYFWCLGIKALRHTLFDMILFY